MIVLKSTYDKLKEERDKLHVTLLLTETIYCEDVREFQDLLREIKNISSERVVLDVVQAQLAKYRRYHDL